MFEQYEDSLLLYSVTRLNPVNSDKKLLGLSLCILVYLRSVSVAALVEEGGVAHRSLRLVLLLAAVLAERTLALVVALQGEVGGRRVVGGAGRGRDLPLRAQRGRAPVPAVSGLQYNTSRPNCQGREEK